MTDHYTDVRSDHPGGNVRTIDRGEGRVRLEQELRDTQRWWFYWNCYLESDRPVTVEFANGPVIGPWGPATSTNGIDWTWLGADSVRSSEAFHHDFSGDSEGRYFAFSVPYQVANFERFYARHEEEVQREVLTVTEQGREVPLLRLGAEDAPADVVLTARHHACESVASYVLEGLLAYLVDSSSPLLDGYQFHVVPFVDVDGVENGSQGKDRAPHDHNRDYSTDGNEVVEEVPPLYVSTATLMEYLRKRNPTIGIDFHCPNKWGQLHDHPHFAKHGSAVDDEVDRLGSFLSDITGRHAQGVSVEYDPENDIEKGHEWNIGFFPNFTNFLVEQGADLATILEFPYFGTDDNRVSPETSRRFGADFGSALERYLDDK